MLMRCREFNLANWYDGNQAIICEAADLFKSQISNDRGWIAPIFIGIMAFIFALLTASEIFQEAYPYILSLKTENISPSTYSLITCLYLALLVLVSTSVRFSKYSKMVRLGLDWSTYAGALMFGLLFGDLAHIITISTDVSEQVRGIFLFIFLLFQICFLLSMLYFFARAVDEKSVEHGFMSRWWTLSPFIRYGLAMSVVALNWIVLLLKASS